MSFMSTVAIMCVMTNVSFYYYYEKRLYEKRLYDYGRYDKHISRTESFSQLAIVKKVVHIFFKVGLFDAEILL